MKRLKELVGQYIAFCKVTLRSIEESGIKDIGWKYFPYTPQILNHIWICPAFAAEPLPKPGLSSKILSNGRAQSHALKLAIKLFLN